MNRTQLISLARRVLNEPTAPYHEQRVAARVRAECERLGLPLRRDRFGNLLIHYRRGKHLRHPLAFVAHMDHPGFEVLERSRNGAVRAAFMGGIVRKCVLRAPVRVFGSKEVAARVTKIDSWGTPQAPKRPQIVRLRVHGPVRRGDFGMWGLRPFAIAGDRLYSRGCDDVVGCVAMLGALRELASRKIHADVWFVFTRAEEVGFHGALALAKSGGLPRSVRVVSVETSKEIPPRARMGGGPIVRVGDRAAVFDSELTRYLSIVSAELAKRDQRFRSQRCLMDGGTCEATAFGENGYQAGALCIALGNYHNIGPRKRIVPEYVSLSDLHNLARLIAAAAQSASRYDKFVNRLRHRLDDLHEHAVRRLAPKFNLLS